MKVYSFTIGCKVNSYESHAVLNTLIHNGFSLGNCKDFDIALINTCSVTLTASQKSRQLIHRIRRVNKNSIIVVMGCLMNNIKEYDYNDLDADIIVGTNNRNEIPSLISKFLIDKKRIIKLNTYKELRVKASYEELGINTYSENTRAYLKIEDGCDNFCSYCIIPNLRGKVRSRNKESILCEVKKIIELGYKEIILTGIDTSSYGKEFKNYNFSDLLEDILIDNKELKRLRISSLEISQIDNKFLTLLSKYKNICDHLHIPIQSGCNETLKRMNRKYSIEEYKEKINKIRKIRPGIAITTDLIVGFPLESEEEFNTTFNNLKEIRFKEIHVFPYSRRENTNAAKLKDNSPQIKKERVNKICQLSKILKETYELKFIGKKLEVLIEKNNVGHTSNYILVKVKGKSGEIKEVNIRKGNIL